MATQEETLPQHPEVFINFRGAELRKGFISYLKRALNRNGFIVHDDHWLMPGAQNHFKGIEESRIAIAIFSSRYTESKWCLEELVKIKERVDEGKLVVIPVFYNLTVPTVRYLKGEFGDRFRDLANRTSDDKIKEWKEALDSVSQISGLVFDETSVNEAFFIGSIVQQVRIVHIRILISQIEKSNNYLLREMQEKASISKLLKVSDAKTNVDFLDRTFTNSPMDGEVKPPKVQVFISFLGEQLRNSFIDHLVAALQRSGINVFIDTHMNSGEDLNSLFKRIEDSGIAIVVFSSRYTQSQWLLEELVKIKERAHQGLLKVLPIFHKVTPGNVQRLEGEFGDHFRDKEYKYRSDEPKIKRWKEAIAFVSHKFALTFDEKSDEGSFIKTIVKEVKNVITRISLEEIEKSHDRLSEQKEGVFVDYPSSEDLKGVDGERDGILWDRNPKEAEIVQPEAKSRRDDGLNPSKDDNFLGDTNSDATSKLKNSTEINKDDPVIDEKKQENIGESSTMVTYDKQLSEHPELFINFCGAELRHGFVGDLVEALKRDGIKIYIDLDELLCGGNEESRSALLIFSRRYTESRLCLNELVKIKELMEEGKLSVIPIFYKLEQLEVTQLKGDFGGKFWNLWRVNRDSHIIKWKEALESFASSKGIYLKEHGSESENITLIVKEVRDRVSLHKGGNKSLFLSAEEGKNTDLRIEIGEKHENYLNKCHLFGMEQCMEQLERKLDFDCKETRIIGVVGMPGIGKTALAMMLHEKWSCKFIRSVPFLGIRKKSEQYEPEWLRKTFLEVLLEGTFPEISDKTTHEFVKVELLQKKIFAVLDDVSNKKQLDFLLGDLGWIKKGSKIVITTCDKSLLKALSHDNYVVPRLNNKESFNLFKYHAFDDQFYSPTKIFEELSRMFVECTRGHPLALKILGRELCGRDKAYWEKKLEILTESSNMLTQYVRRFSIDQLNDRQKDVFLDIVCFFNSEDEYFVKSLLGSGDSDSNDAVSEVIDLANKFLITISDGRVEMNHLLYMFGKDLSSPEQYWLWNYTNIINMPTEMEEREASSVRGISVDMSKVAQIIPLQRMAFTNMLHLRYLKIYDSYCPRKCKATCNLYFPDGVEFPLEEVRYLHWVKFPLQELPADFRPKNLVDLRLPYSNIERVWEGVKDTQRLKWVDLSHSSKLFDLSALSKAENLQRLNLEGCTSLDELPLEIQNMKSLVFLNLRGCIGLCSVPKMNLISLKTLILSDCSNLEEFELISESVEFLHLDGTSIKGLPLAIKTLKRLVVLNLKNCKMLECLPKCLGELKALEELILSGCSRLKDLSDVRESMKHLQSLLIDRIGAKEMPNISCVSEANDQASTDMSVEPMGPSKQPHSVDGVSALQRLCLSGNDFVSLPDIDILKNLKWLDVKHCKKLRCVPMLPPRLEYFDAHGCDSLEGVAKPLALQDLSEHIHATFNFSKCNKLDQDAKDSIISYTRWRSQLGLDELIRFNGGVFIEALIGTCLPGWEVPAWFSHQASGPVLESKLPPHWCNNKFSGIALCAVISFPAYHERRNRLLVKCNCVFNNEDGSHIRFSCTIGSWSEPSSTPGTCEPSHVFIGYTSVLNIKKHDEEEVEEGCSHTNASFEFQVTDGTQVIGGCEVLKCGFSLVYATNERENICWDAKAVVIPENIENIPGEALSYGNSGSHDEYFVRSLLDSENPEAMSEVRDMADKFLIVTFSGGRVEMHDQLHTLGEDLGSPGKRRLQNYKDIINTMTEMKQSEANNVRGIFLDMSEITKSIALDCMIFAEMLNLRYLKIYDSYCPRKCKATCNLYFPDGVEFPLEEVRYLHWVKFPLQELPADFRPKNLVDLRLPYSNIERVWEGVKDTQRLKWVDLSHSSKLFDLSALSKAENLQRLNLEGCTSLDEFPLEIQNMKSLVFLNLRGCIGLCSVPKMNLISLKTLILSDCSNLEEFELISESVEFLHLDGTSIKGLPLAIKNLKRLVVLNLKNCKMLECLPKCLGELKALEELILSGCSRLKNLSDVRESMKHLQSLLIDRIGAKEMPNISCVSEANDQAFTDMSVDPMGPSKQPRSVNGVSSLLRRLCLSGNDFVSLQPDIEILYNLKWLDVKHCKKLRCVPMLPPKLEYFDAHGCDSLESVANPLAVLMLSEQIDATFNFSNCYNLDQDAKDSIISYTRRKSQLVLDEISRYNRGLVLEVLIGTCFPGWEVPSWFIHHASGSELNLKLPPHWCDNRFTGIGLCAVIVFHGNHDQRKHVLVKCNCEFKNGDGCIIRFSCTVGGWSEPSNTPRNIESSHVFIGFTSKLDINKIAEEDDEEKCFSTETSIKFQVTDGREEIKGSEVLKCGFSLLYAPEERRNICSGFKDL